MSGIPLFIKVFILISSIAGFAAFYWAVFHRQLRGSEESKFTMFEADTPLATQPRPWNGQVWLMMGVMLLIFGFIGWSIVLTIVAANHTPVQTQDASQSVASPM